MSSKIRLTFEEASELRAQQRYEQGWAEGRAKAMDASRTFFCGLLEKRLGSLSEELLRKIKAADDDDQLVTIVLEAFDIPLWDGRRHDDGS